MLYHLKHQPRLAEKWCFTTKVTIGVKRLMHTAVIAMVSALKDFYFNQFQSQLNFMLETITLSIPKVHTYLKILIGVGV